LTWVFLAWFLSAETGASQPNDEGLHAQRKRIPQRLRAASSISPDSRRVPREQTILFNYKEVINGKNLKQNIYLENGDIVMVP
jgi:hypothetical protein